MSIMQNFHGYSDTDLVVAAVGEVDGVADIGEKNKLISISCTLLMCHDGFWLSWFLVELVELRLMRLTSRWCKV